MVRVGRLSCLGNLGVRVVSFRFVRFSLLSASGASFLVSFSLDDPVDPFPLVKLGAERAQVSVSELRFYWVDGLVD